MVPNREDRHWKSARLDLFGSDAESIQIFSRPQSVVRETNRAIRATRSARKESNAEIVFLLLLTLSTLQKPALTERRHRRFAATSRPSLPSRARSGVSTRPNIPSGIGERGR